MLETAALGIAVVLAEGTATATLNSADVVCVGIVPALELLLNPLRLTATLRS
jgi:soluble P-type ATPase